MAEIFLSPDELWDYFQEHTADFEKSVLLAKSGEGLFEIYASGDDYGEIGIYVLAGGEVINEESAVDKFDCEEIITTLYNSFIYDGAENDYEMLEQSDMISERETALDVAITGFLETIAPSVLDDVNCDNIIADLLDMVCARLYDKYGISVYRPMYITGDNDVVEFSEFPYEEIEVEL